MPVLHQHTMSEEETHQVELENQRETLEMQNRQRLRIMRLKRQGAMIVYANQSEAANMIVQKFMEGKVWIVLVAPPGAGKTGVILEVLRLLGQHPLPEHQIHIKNMLVMTGMSDTDWSKTMKDGMLEALHSTVYHRAELKKVNLDNMRNGIVVTDECHVAAQLDQTIDKKLKESGLKNIDTLRARNMRMLDVSATPEGVSSDLEKWKDHTARVDLHPDEKYKGFAVMKSEGRLLNARDYDFEDREQAMAFVKKFDDRYKKCHTKKYFPMRVYSPTARANLIDACHEFGWEYEDHDSKNRVEDIDAVMEKPPANNKHKMFFVKGFWRASKRLVKNHAGGSYESVTIRSDDTSKSQGLTARFCNTYDYEGEQLDPNLRPLHFDDVESIDRYLAWLDAGCDYKEAAYKAPRLRADGEGAVKHPKTKADPDSVVGVVKVEDDPQAPQVAPERQRAAHAGPRVNRTNYPRMNRQFESLDSAREHYIALFGDDTGFAAKPRRCNVTRKWKCSFSNVKSAVLTVDQVRRHLASGNLWGAHQSRLDDEQDACPQIGTVKIGYNGDVATYFLCVQSKRPFDL